MIHVIATIELKPNSREDYLTVLRNNVSNVKAEAGCLGYEPAVDIDSGLPAQEAVRETPWTHRTKPFNMHSNRDAVTNYVHNVSSQIMAPA